jgi:hypothetical protein
MRASGEEMKRLARGLTATALLIVAAAAALAAPAMGSAVVIRDTVTSPIFETGVSHDCRPGITGTVTGTDVTSFQSVETSTGFHIDGTNADSGRIDWSDGTYTLIQSVDHFSFNALGTGTTTFTNAHQDAGDFYSADGVFEFRDTFHEVEHLTVTNGVVRVQFSKGHFHFFGDC